MDNTGLVVVLQRACSKGPSEKGEARLRLRLAVLLLASHVHRKGILLPRAAVENLLANGAANRWKLPEEGAGWCASAYRQGVLPQSQMLADLNYSGSMTEPMACDVVDYMQGLLR